VQQNEAYLAVIVLARVIVRLGMLPEIHTGIIEGLYASDLAYLQRLYEHLNSGDEADSPLRGAMNGATIDSPRRATALGEA